MLTTVQTTVLSRIDQKSSCRKTETYCGRTVYQIGSLAGDRGDDVKVAQLLVLLVERLDELIGMGGVILPDELVKEIALAADFLVPDADTSAGIGCAVACGQER
jgi:hypothetical protein